MKTKRYTFTVVFLFAVSILLSSDIIAQPGRYGHRRSYSRYYPQRSYYYNQPYVSIRFGGNYYRYQRGYFYRPYGASFRFIIPPIGIRISTLPIGYYGFNVGPSPYYYYNGIYYRPYGSNQYEVVAPPLGAVVKNLPPGTKATVIDGKKYYEYDGTYYEESITQDSKLRYTVVGIDGVLNTDDAGEVDDATTSDAAVEPSVGDRLDTLPANSKAVVIKGEKLYVSPAGIYYKEVIDGNKVTYEVVGK